MEMTPATPKTFSDAPQDKKLNDQKGEQGHNDSNKPNSDKMWRGRIDRCTRIRTDLVKGFADNVDYRRGKPFSQYDDEDRVNVNIDWAMTKSKHAQLFSQLPQVYLTPKRKQFAAAMSPFQKQLNDTIEEIGVGDAINESVLDCINASGYGCCLVGYHTLTEEKEVPVLDGQPIDPAMLGQMAPDLHMALLQSKRLGSEKVDAVTSQEYFCNRFSPSELLWPIEFTGSNFDRADWIGKSGKMLITEAQQAWNLSEEQLEKCKTQAAKDKNLRRETDKNTSDEPVVEYEEVYYWKHRFDPECKYFKQIGHILFIKGIKESIFNEDWKGQHFDENSHKYVGSCKFPIRVLTLTYISDDAIPPSDTAIARPQVEEMIKSRTQIVKNRERSQPIRWYDVNGVDTMVGDALQKGEYQGFIPMNGPGERKIGEVARASYPREDFEFDNIIRQDLNEQWNVGPNQLANFAKGRRSAKEASNAEAAFQTRVGYERARVAAYLTGIAEVLGGLMALFGDFEILGQDEIQRIDQSWDRKAFGNEYVYWIRPDSTVLLDANQRIDKLMHLLNLVGKSGFVNPKPLISEIVELHGADPADIVVDPQPPKPDEPNLSFRFSGLEDLSHPLVLAFLAKSGQLPGPQDIEAAKQAMMAADMPPQPPQQQGGPDMPPGAPGAPQPGGPKGPMPPGVNPQQAGMKQAAWAGMPKVFKRNSDM